MESNQVIVIPEFDFEKLFVRIEPTLKETLKCPRCRKIMITSVIVCQGGDVMCSDCARDYLRENKTGVCDKDNTKLLERPIPNATFNEVMKKQQIYCQYGCGQITTIQDREYHEGFCENYPIDCKNKCGKQFRRKDLTEHLQRICQHRIITCGCGIQIKWFERDKHEQNVCTRIVICEFCEREWQRKELRHHDEKCFRESIYSLNQLIPCLTTNKLQEILKQYQKDSQQIISFIKQLKFSMSIVLEIFCLPSSLREASVIKAFIECLLSKKNTKGFTVVIMKPVYDWAWLMFETQEEGQKFKKYLEEYGFPYIRNAYTNEDGLLRGETSSMTFKPPLSMITCMFSIDHSEFPIDSCPFYHHKDGSLLGDCKRWSVGCECNVPFCKYVHSGQVVSKLNYQRKEPNPCKRCQNGTRHYYWECYLLTRKIIIEEITKELRVKNKILLSKLETELESKTHLWNFLINHEKCSLQTFLAKYEDMFYLSKTAEGECIQLKTIQSSEPRANSKPNK